MTESPLQKALRRLKAIELEYRETQRTSGLVPLVMAELILQEMEAEMTELCTGEPETQNY